MQLYYCVFLTLFETVKYPNFTAFTDEQVIVAPKLDFVLQRVEHCGKRRKCWLPASSPLPTMFSKAVVSRGVKSRDCVVTSALFTTQ